MIIIIVVVVVIIVIGNRTLTQRQNMTLIAVDVRKSGASVGYFFTCYTLHYPQIPRSPFGTPRTMTSFWKGQSKKRNACIF